MRRNQFRSVGRSPKDDVVNHDINVDLKKAPLKDVLDHLVLTDPSYRWKLEDGVINFYPAFNRDERHDQLLKVRIKEFSRPKGLYVFDFGMPYLICLRYAVFLNLVDWKDRTVRIVVDLVRPSIMTFERPTRITLTSQQTNARDKS